MSVKRMSWSSVPEPTPRPERPAVNSAMPLAADDMNARPVGIGAYCTLAETEHPDAAQSFAVTEYVDLDNGTRVSLHSQRGFTIGVGNTGNLRSSLTATVVSDALLTAVLPDGEDVMEAHPYEWLAELAHQRGLSLLADDLRRLPYRVVLDGDVLAWLASETEEPQS